MQESKCKVIAITNQTWGQKENYDLCLNCEIGIDKIVDIICDYIEKIK